MKLNSLYICVKDMKRAIAFYEGIFNKKIDKSDERYSIFEIDDFLFGLFDPKKDNEQVSYGNNIVPNIEVEDADAEHNRLKENGTKIVMDICTINGYRLFQFEDSEGNIIEIYTVLEGK